MDMVTLEQAQKIVAGALAYARENNLKPMGIVVLDARGALRAAAVEDGASLGRWKVAYGKANGAISLGVNSRVLGAMAVERPHFVGSLGAVFSDGVVPVAGGVLIYDQSGHIAGAAGASGDTSDNDEAALIAAIAHAGLKS
ncbi:MAG: heme-binding protein [Rhodomicrobium sp.]